MKLVRAKHPNGGEFTTSEARAKSKGLQTVDKPTHDRFGRLIPAKPGTKKDGTPAPTPPADTPKKEGSK